MKEKQVAVCLLGRIGDIIASEPIFPYLRKKYPDHRIIWYTSEKYVSLHKFHPAIDEIVAIDSVSKWLDMGFPEGTIKVPVFMDGARCPATGRSLENANPARINFRNYFKYGSLLEVWSQVVGLEKLSAAPKFYIDPMMVVPFLPERYIVFHCNALGKTRHWGTENWNRLAESALKSGMTVVEIGMEKVIASNASGYMDFTGQRNFHEIARIIEKAECFVGVESSFAHMANALGVYGVIVAGALRHFKRYMPYSGRYADSSNCSFLQVFGEPCRFLPYTVVEAALHARLAGVPWDRVRCIQEVLDGQLERYQSTSWFKIEYKLRRLRSK